MASIAITAKGNFGRSLAGILALPRTAQPGITARMPQCAISALSASAICRGWTGPEPGSHYRSYVNGRTDVVDI